MSNKTASSNNESMFDDHAYCKPKNITNESQESINLIQKIKETNELEIHYKDGCTNELDKWLNTYENLISLIRTEDIEVPVQYSDILNSTNSEQWYAAVTAELLSLKQNKTWVLVDRPQNKNIVTCKWVFRVKSNQNGSAHIFKARLVARGFSQQYGIDYKETYSPVAKMKSFRILMALAVQYDLHVHQLDVKTAFLQSELKEEVYMKVPEGIQCPANKVCLLKKNLDGLKQAPRYWNKKLDSYLKSLGFIQNKSDYCVYHLNKPQVEENFYILVYVDDLLLITKNINYLQLMKEKLSQKFEMIDDGPLRCVLTCAKFSKQTKQTGCARTNGVNMTNEHLSYSRPFAVFGAFPDVRHKLFSRQIDQFGRQNVSANVIVNLAAGNTTYVSSTALSCTCVIVFPRI